MIPSGPAMPGSGLPGKAPELAKTHELEPGAPDSGWRSWWSFNADGVLDLSDLLSGLESSTGVDQSGEALLTPRAQRVRDVGVPALRAILRDPDSELVQRSALVALARVPVELDALAGSSDVTPFDELARFHLAGKLQGTAEAAVLALALRGGDAARADLVELLLNTARGRELRQDVSVDPRTRAFAAYGLGLIGSQLADAAQREEIGGALAKALSDPTSTYELHAAALLAMGQVPVGDCPGGDAPHVCRGEQIDYLIDYWQNKDVPVELRAHAVPAMARLASGGAPKYKEIAARFVLDELERRDLEPLLASSCAIALGTLGDGDKDALDGEIRGALERLAERGAPGAQDGPASNGVEQRLALVALARASAREGTSEGEDKSVAKAAALLAKLCKHGTDDRQAWAALALGVLGDACRESGRAVPLEIAPTLSLALIGSKSPDRTAAACLALGILRDGTANEDLLERFLEDESAEVRANAALALGLSRASEAGAALREALAPSARLAAGAAGTGGSAGAKPATLAGIEDETAIALRLLGERDAASLLAARLAEIKEPGARAEIARSLGDLGDARALDTLAKLLADKTEKPEVRAAAARGIGAVAAIASGDEGHWASAYASDLNYGILTWTLASPFRDGTGLLDLD